jgi:hypothetical protein
LIVLVPHQPALSELAMCRDEIMSTLKHPILITFGSGNVTFGSGNANGMR